MFQDKLERKNSVWMSKLKYIKVYLHFDLVYFGIFLQVFFKHSMINESGQKIIKG